MVEPATTNGVPGSSKQPAGGSTFVQGLRDLPYALAVLQFLLVTLPYGFCNLAGINIPYSDAGFLTGLLVLLLLTGPLLGMIAFALMKAEIKMIATTGGRFDSVHARMMPLASYGMAFMSMLLYFTVVDGWLSELVPMMVYFAYVLVSGVVAMLGLMARRVYSQGSRVQAFGFCLAFLVTGAAWLFPAITGLEMLLVAGMIIAIAIPPLLALDRAAVPPSVPTTDPRPATRFAWCDNVLEKGGPRSWMTTALALLLSIGLGNFFATLFYLKTPVPAYPLQALLFFAGIATSMAAFSIAFKTRNSDGLIWFAFATMIAITILNDLLPGFSNSPVSLLVNGIGTGATFTLVLRFQAFRNGHAKLPDFPGNRTVEFFYYTFLAALFGLIFSLTVTWEGLRVDIPGTLPARILFGGIVIGLALIILATFNSNSRYLKKVDRGEAVKKSTTSSDLNMFFHHVHHSTVKQPYFSSLGQD